jgi:ribose 5-phosphate isomerase B
MKLVIAADKGGFALKEHLVPYLLDKGYVIADVGMLKADEPVWWHKGCLDAVRILRAGKADLAILICGSGAGMAMLANKHRGVFAVPCESVQTARMARQFLNANVLTMGGYVVSPELAEEIADTFLTTAFAAGETEERKEYLNGQLRDLYLLDEACWKE